MKKLLSLATAFVVVLSISTAANADWDTEIDGRIDAPDNYDNYMVGCNIGIVGEMSDPEVFPYARIELFHADANWNQVGTYVAQTNAFALSGEVHWGSILEYNGWGAGRYLIKLKLYGATVDVVRIYYHDHEEQGFPPGN